jgi:hypothetical protein
MKRTVTFLHAVVWSFTIFVSLWARLAAAQTGGDSFLSVTREFSFEHPVFKMSLAHDGSCAAFATIYREREPVYGPASGSSEIWTCNFANSDGPKLYCRFPGRRIPAIAISDQGKYAACSISDFVVSFFPLQSDNGHDWGQVFIEVSELLITGAGDWTAVSEVPSELIEFCDRNDVRVRVHSLNGEHLLDIPTAGRGIPENLATNTAKDLLAIYLGHGKCEIWNVPKKSKVLFVTFKFSQELMEGRTSLAISPDSKLLALCDQRQLVIWQIADGRVVSSATMPEIIPVNGRCAFIDTDLLAVFCSPSTDPPYDRSGLRLWRVVDNSLVEGPFVKVDADIVEFSEKGDVLWNVGSNGRRCMLGKLNIPEIRKAFQDK